MKALEYLWRIITSALLCFLIVSAFIHIGAEPSSCTVFDKWDFLRVVGFILLIAGLGFISGREYEQ